MFRFYVDSETTNRMMQKALFTANCFWPVHPTRQVHNCRWLYVDRAGRIRKTDDSSFGARLGEPVNRDYNHESAFSVLKKVKRGESLVRSDNA